MPSRFVQIFLAAAGIPVTTKSLLLSKGEHLTEEYRAINPKAEVPAIIHKTEDGEFRLAESYAIVEYLAETFPEQAGSLLGAGDARLAARIREAMHRMHPIFFKHNGLMGFYGFFVPLIGREPDVDKACAEMDGLLKRLELFESVYFNDSPEHLVGTSLTAADVGLYTALEHAYCCGFEAELAPEGPLPKVAHFLASMRADKRFANIHDTLKQATIEAQPDTRQAIVSKRKEALAAQTAQTSE